MNYHVDSCCHKGPIRTNNEDAIRYGFHNALDVFWMLVADGMGGHNAGEVASTMLVEHFEQALNNTAKVKPVHWQTWLSEELNKANLAILDAAKNNAALQGMGTTGVLVIIDNGACHVAWVGDSRAYLLQNHQLTQLTIDHTMIQELVNKGAITAEDAKNANTKNLLSQAIGVREHIRVDTAQHAVILGDTIMLSSDGVHDYLSDDTLCHYLADYSSLKSVSNDMIKQAIAQTSRDNLTVGLVKIEH
jgi:serine/threonine protein phosphatase PrpC